MARTSALARIRALDPLRDHQEIMYLVSTQEFPFDLTRALEFALYRTFAIPRIGALLYRTGEFVNRTQKRYDDTDLILSEIIEYGYDSDRGRTALEQLNSIHGRFQIANEDFLYVLSTLTYEPIRWMDRFGWRPMVEQERLASYYYWREVGRRMQIQQIPDSYEAFEAFNREYEQANFQYTPAGQRVASATRDLFLGWVLPRRLYFLGRPVIYALIDDRLGQALGFPTPPAWLRVLVQSAVRLRARLAHRFLRRAHPRLRTREPHRTYPSGYEVSGLGPPPNPAPPQA
jgi:hypothetical protein